MMCDGTASSLGEILCSEQFPILKHVLSFLNAKTLCVVAQVCTLWLNAVKRVLKQRRFWKSQLFQDLHEYEVNINNLPLFPSTVVRLYSHHEINMSAPTNCAVVSAKVGGTIGMEGNNMVATEVLEDGTSLLSMNRFSDGIKCTPFVVRDSDLKLIRKNKLSFFASIHFNPGDCRKLVVFLLMSGKSLKELIKSIKTESTNQRLVIIGGRCEKTAYDKKQGSVSGFIIHGEVEPFLRIYQGYSEEELRNALSVLKEESQQKHYKYKESMMLMVSCVGRGPYCYQKNNAECDVISQIFPQLPVFGFFGLGEIAYDSLDELNKDCYEYAYTSVFCLLNLLA